MRGPNHSKKYSGAWTTWPGRAHAQHEHLERTFGHVFAHTHKVSTKVAQFCPNSRWASTPTDTLKIFFMYRVAGRVCSLLFILVLFGPLWKINLPVTARLNFWNERSGQKRVQAKKKERAREVPTRVSDKLSGNLVSPLSAAAVCWLKTCPKVR